MSDTKIHTAGAKRCSKIAVSALFTVAYAILLSLGVQCLLNLSGAFFAISLDSGSAVEQYPKFIAFCIFIGLAALVALVLLAILNIKVSEKLEYTKKLWYAQCFFAFIISIPMMKIWEMPFDFLHQAF